MATTGAPATLRPPPASIVAAGKVQIDVAMAEAKAAGANVKETETKVAQAMATLEAAFAGVSALVTTAITTSSVVVHVATLVAPAATAPSLPPLYTPSFSGSAPTPTVGWTTPALAGS